MRIMSGISLTVLSVTYPINDQPPLLFDTARMLRKPRAALGLVFAPLRPLRLSTPTCRIFLCCTYGAELCFMTCPSLCKGYPRVQLSHQSFFADLPCLLAARAIALVPLCPQRVCRNDCIFGEHAAACTNCNEKQQDQVCIEYPRELGGNSGQFRIIPQANAIDAITKSSGRRPIIKNMTQMSTAGGAVHFSATQLKKILPIANGAIHWCSVARPTCARIELLHSWKQRCAATCASVCATWLCQNLLDTNALKWSRCTKSGKGETNMNAT